MKPTLAPLTKSGDKCIVPVSKWWAIYRGADGNEIRESLHISDATMAQRKLSELELKVDRQRSGTAAPHEFHLIRPIVELIREYRASLEDNDRDQQYVDNAISYLEKTVEACKFQTLGAVDVTKVESYLSRRRKKGLRRGGHNSYVRTLKAFGGWLFKTRRYAQNPFATLSQLNADVDRDRVRRPATLDELQWLITAAVAAEPFLGLPGPDRVILYAVAVCTGIRVSELASITPESLRLEDDVPTITVAAGYSKHRKEDVQPIPPAIAARLKNWLAENPVQSRRPLWPGRWRERAAEMLRSDLAAARKEWVKAATDRAEKVRRRGDRNFLRYRDSDERVFDFHALRGTFATNLALAGTHPKAAQELMRHSDINLTMGTYTNLPKAAIAAELHRLPPVPEAATGKKSAVACTVSCTPSRDAQEHREHNALENSGAAGTRTQNQQIMSLLL